MDLKKLRELTEKNLEVAEAECHQIMVALKPWISGNPDRSRLDLAHFGACAFRAWGANISALTSVRELLDRIERLEGALKLVAIQVTPEEYEEECGDEMDEATATEAYEAIILDARQALSERKEG